MTIYRVQDDTDSPIEDTLEDGSGNAVDISGFNSLDIHITKPDGTTITDDTSGNVTADDAANGDVSYQFQSSDLDQTGQYDYEWQVTFSDGGIETFPSQGYEHINVRAELS